MGWFEDWRAQVQYKNIQRYQEISIRWEEFVEDVRERPIGYPLSLTGVSDAVKLAGYVGRQTFGFFF